MNTFNPQTNFRDNRFFQESKVIFREKSPSQFDPRPMSPVYGKEINHKFDNRPFQQLKSPSFYSNKENVIIKPPSESITYMNPIYTFDPNNQPQQISKPFPPPSIVINQPPTSQIRYSPSPNTKTILTNSQVLLPPATTTILPPTYIPTTTTYVTQAPPIIHQPNFQIPYQNITHVQTIRTSNVNEQNSQINKLKAMNDFLSQNYTLVYNKLKQLQSQKLQYRSMYESESINQVLFLRSAVNKIQQIYDYELESALTRLKSMMPKIQVYKTVRVGI